MIELRSARDMRVTHMLIIAFQQNTFGIAVSPDPSSLSTWKGHDQTTTKAKQTKRKVQDIEDINDDSDKEIAIVAPVAHSKCPTKTIKYYFSDDKYDD